MKQILTNVCICNVTTVCRIHKMNMYNKLSMKNRVAKTFAKRYTYICKSLDDSCAHYWHYLDQLVCVEVVNCSAK